MGNNWQQGPFRIPTFKDFVPHNVKFALLIAFACCFQLSGGVYLAATNQLVGCKTLLQEDVMMAAYASFIGLTVTFPLLFRVKFRFKSRSIIIAAATTIAVCNIIIMNTDNLILIMATSFIVGMCRLLGTFECMSTLQGKLAPNHDQTIFFCVLFCIILSAIQLSGIATVYLDFFYNWRYMHLFIAALLLAVAMTATLFMKNIRLTDKYPLTGIDWQGFILWSVFLLSSSYTLLYGKHFEWFDSQYICIGTVVSIISLLLAIRRMLTAEQPFFSPEIFGYKGFKSSLLLIMIMSLLLATPNTIEGVMTSGILHFHGISTVSINWVVLAGGICGSLFSFYTLVIRKMFYKWIIFAGFACLVSYQGIMYFLIDSRTALYMFYIPAFLRGAGYTTLFVTLTLYSIKNIPFKYFLQPIGILGFIRTGVGSVAAASLVTNLMNFLIRENCMNLGWELDAVNRMAAGMHNGELYGELARQALMVSAKQILGWFTILGIITLAAIPSMRYIRPVMRNMPKMKQYRKITRNLYKLHRLEDKNSI